MDQKRSKPDRGTKRRIRGKLSAAIAFLAVTAVLAGGAYAYWRHQQRLYIMEQYEIDSMLNVDTFYEGVYVDGISLGGLSPDRARQLIGENQKPLIDSIRVSIRVGDAVTVFTAKDMAVSFDTEEVLAKAWDTGRQGDRLSRYDYVKGLPEYPMRFTTAMSVDASALEQRILAIADFYDVEPVNASILKFNPDPAATQKFLFEPEIYGMRVNAQAAWEEIKILVGQRKWGQTVMVQTTEIKPDILLSEIEASTRLISRFETAMGNVPNRIHNITLACSKITGAVIMPGEEFSFNGTTGPRTYATGYVDANVIVGGKKLEEGVAGGVCQVSGTLFNALVMADLEITKRSHHSFELGYLTRGRDATVDYPTGTDLRCRNNGDTPVYLVMYVEKLKVIAEVYGMPLPDGIAIDIFVKTIEESPPGDPIWVADDEVPIGEMEVVGAHPYIKCQSYRIYKAPDGSEIRREELILDVYKAIRMEYHVNPASMPTPIPPPTPSPSPSPASG